jgi:hypothetical protein
MHGKTTIKTAANCLWLIAQGAFITRRNAVVNFFFSPLYLIKYFDWTMDLTNTLFSKFTFHSKIVIVNVVILITDLNFT